ncbi:MAG: class I SAM-dependent methyltransferase [Candidatus Eisenbacteria bacterium]|uniref:Class I SAM-dependent methyltransferase n=1 Tax=Eiseniibacteriota bacterium TaxID=2212470 RepID=A0A948S1J8_UNCEI|nr:class I SAM-dependent methyltransferase [Candidatus Eisenbacteria bacterium]
MSEYGGYTYGSSFPLKRWLHRRRFEEAIHILSLSSDDTLLDYGCGDGFLLKQIMDRDLLPGRQLVGYEPAEVMYQQCKAQLAGTDAKIVSTLSSISNQIFSRVCCLETCEHLSDTVLADVLNDVAGSVKTDGMAVISVPVEIGIPALLKNTFRYFKNPKGRGLTLKKFIQAFLGLKIDRGEAGELSDLPYYYSHIGFDYRVFKQKLEQYLVIDAVTYSPLHILGPFLGMTVYYTCTRRPTGSHDRLQEQRS